MPATEPIEAFIAREVGGLLRKGVRGVEVL